MESLVLFFIGVVLLQGCTLWVQKEIFERLEKRFDELEKKLEEKK